MRRVRFRENINYEVSSRAGADMYVNSFEPGAVAENTAFVDFLTPDLDLVSFDDPCFNDFFHRSAHSREFTGEPFASAIAATERGVATAATAATARAAGPIVFVISMRGLCGVYCVNGTVFRCDAAGARKVAAVEETAAHVARVVADLRAAYPGVEVGATAPLWRFAVEGADGLRRELVGLGVPVFDDADAAIAGARFLVTDRCSALLLRARASGLPLLLAAPAGDATLQHPWARYHHRDLLLSDAADVDPAALRAVSRNVVRRLERPAYLRSAVAVDFADRMRAVRRFGGADGVAAAGGAPFTSVEVVGAKAAAAEELFREGVRAAPVWLPDSRAHGRPLMVTSVKEDAFHLQCAAEGKPDWLGFDRFDLAGGEAYRLVLGDFSGRRPVFGATGTTADPAGLPRRFPGLADAMSASRSPPPGPPDGGGLPLPPARVLFLLDNPGGVNYAGAVDIGEAWAARWRAAVRLQIGGGGGTIGSSGRSPLPIAPPRLAIVRFHPNSPASPACLRLRAVLAAEFGGGVRFGDLDDDETREPCFDGFDAVVCSERSSCVIKARLAGTRVVTVQALERSGWASSGHEADLGALFRDVVPSAEVRDGSAFTAAFLSVNGFPHLAGARVHAAPFGHILTSVSDELYDGLTAAFPADAAFRRLQGGAPFKSNCRYNINLGHVARGLHELRPEWASFFFGRGIWALFRGLCAAFGCLEEYGGVRPEDIGTRHDASAASKRITYDCIFCINSANTGGEPDSIKPPHVDEHDKVFCMLFYMPEAGDEAGQLGGDLELYAVRGTAGSGTNGTAVGGGAAPPIAELGACNAVARPGETLTLAKTVPYRRNTLLWFHNERLRAVHGVSPRLCGRATRRFVNIVFEDRLRPAYPTGGADAPPFASPDGT